MPQSYPPEPSLIAIERRRCPKCEHVHKVLAEDPMKSDHAGWLASELKPQQTGYWRRCRVPP